MNKVSLGFILSIFLIALLSEGGYCSERKLLPVDISGKILDKDGKEISGDVTLIIKVSKHKDDASNMYGFVEIKDTLELKSQGSRFSWTGEATSVSVLAQKDSYYSTEVDVPFSGGPDVVNGKYAFIPFQLTEKDILIYLIPKGNPSSLEFTRGGEIPDIDEQKSGGKQCGWSFSKRWYFPVDGDKAVDIVRGVNEDGKSTYTIKEPGGFIYFEGYPKFENSTERYYADFDLMPEAPESGYVPTFTPAEHKPDDRYRKFCYFKTPEGRYGKICFSGDFDYYLQPDGSRNLEVDKIWNRPPLNPKAEHMPDDPVAYPVNPEVK